MMNDSYGNKTSRIWLIGDSPPNNYAEHLRFPLDSHHPAVHNIWTPVLAEINDYLFDYGLRLKNSSLYIRNAVNCLKYWEDNHKDDRACLIRSMKQELTYYNPTVVITFGSRAYEMTRQALLDDESITGNLRAWSSCELGKIFRTTIGSFSSNIINILPLLHTSVSRRYFLKGQANYCGIKMDEYKQQDEKYDYFAYIGKEIGIKLHQDYFIKVHKTLMSRKE